jgi:hypothetical protein
MLQKYQYARLTQASQLLRKAIEINKAQKHYLTFITVEDYISNNKLFEYVQQYNLQLQALIQQSLIDLKASLDS